MRKSSSMQAKMVLSLLCLCLLRDALTEDITPTSYKSFSVATQTKDTIAGLMDVGSPTTHTVTHPGITLETTQQSNTADSNTAATTPQSTTNNPTAIQESTTNKPITNPQITVGSPIIAVTTKHITSYIWDTKWDEPFRYEYRRIRHIGLAVAAVLFILGILILTCGRLRRIPRCHCSLRPGRSYRVTRV